MALKIEDILRKNDINVALRTKLFEAGIISTPSESDEYWPVHLTYSGGTLPYMLDKYQHKLICDLFNTYREMKFEGGGIWISKVHFMMCLAANPNMFTGDKATPLDIKHGLTITSTLGEEMRAMIRTFCDWVPEIMPNTWIALYMGLYGVLKDKLYNSPGSPYDGMCIIKAYKLIFSREFCGEGTQATVLDGEDVTDQVL